MLASWMLYCVAIGVLVSAGAVALERGLRSLQRPTRWPWAGATALTLAIPIAAWMVPTAPLAPEPTLLRVTADAGGSPEALPTRMRSAPRTLDLARWDAPLRLAWGGSSLAVVVALCAMGAVLARRRRMWSAAEVDGVPVLVSADTGPAVVGLVRSRIVLPAWALRADVEARRLVLEHEQEHVRAGDPRLLAAALLAAALIPWNPAVWWQLRRLRLAVEVDCDARVLRRRGDVHAYGSVLLEMGRRASHTRLAAVAAFAEPVSTLERRIRIMTAPRVRRPLLRATGFAGIAAGLVFAACEAPGPMQPSPAGSRRIYAAEGAEPQGKPRAKIDIREMVSSYFPEVAREGLSRDESLYFTLSPEGEIIGHARRRLSRPTGYAVGANGRRLTVHDPVAELGIDRSTIRSIDNVAQPAGTVAPTPVQVVLVQLKRPGVESGSLRMASIPPAADIDSARRMLDQQAVADRAAMIATVREPRGAVADPAELQAAMYRVFAPGTRAGGITGTLQIRYTVGADGRAHDVMVQSENPALVPAGHSIMETLTFPSSAAGKQATLFLTAGRPLAPARNP